MTVAQWNKRAATYSKCKTRYWRSRYGPPGMAWMRCQCDDGGTWVDLYALKSAERELPVRKKLEGP